MITLVWGWFQRLSLNWLPNNVNVKENRPACQPPFRFSCLLDLASRLDTVRVFSCPPAGARETPTAPPCEDGRTRAFPHGAPGAESRAMAAPRGDSGKGPAASTHRPRLRPPDFPALPDGRGSDACAPCAVSGEAALPKTRTFSRGLPERHWPPAIP